jgi:hypothetical protein
MRKKARPGEGSQEKGRQAQARHVLVVLAVLGGGASRHENSISAMMGGETTAEARPRTKAEGRCGRHGRREQAGVHGLVCRQSFGSMAADT